MQIPATWGQRRPKFTKKNISSRASFSPKNEEKFFIGCYVYLDLFFYAGAAYHLLNGDVGADGRSEDGGENPSVGLERERKARHRPLTSREKREFEICFPTELLYWNMVFDSFLV